jgi:ATP-dependent Clp protease ATP-binding subunit ClpC
MFERFTDRARRVVVLAQEEARRLDHSYIGTEHLLLGLLREGDGVAARALSAMRISLDEVRREIEEIIGRGSQAPSGHIPFTPRAKKVLELSLREAQQLGHTYIGTEHLLLGLIREGEGVAAQVLVTLGADLDRVRQQVVQLLRGQRAEPAPAPPGSRAFEPAQQAGAGSPPAAAGPVRAQLGEVLARLDEIMARLDDIAGRLTNLEHGQRRPGPPAPAAPDAAEGEPPAEEQPG